MPRKRHSGMRGTRFVDGIFSATTFVTNPSGVTLDSTTGVDATGKSVLTSGVTITAGNVQNDEGYMIGYPTADYKMVSGVTKIVGSATNQSFTGITSIMHLLLQPMGTKAGVTRIYTWVGSDGEWLAAGVSNVDIFIYSGLSVPTYMTSAVSLAYTVFGTA